MRAAWVCLVAIGSACGGGGGQGPGHIDALGGDTADAIPHVPGDPAVGAHGLAYFRLGGQHADVLTTPAMETARTGSTLVVSTGRGQLGAMAAPTDSYANAPYLPLGTAHPYTMWPSSGTAVYAFPAITGGPGHEVRVTTPALDEVTAAVVEVVDGTDVVAAEWREVLHGSPLTSASVTTTGPATLVAFWWGDADVDGDKTAVPDNGFTVIDSILEAGALVQCAVAVRNVEAAGTYDVTWDATPIQGAQLWLVAVQ